MGKQERWWEMRENYSSVIRLVMKMKEMAGRGRKGGRIKRNDNRRSRRCRRSKKRQCRIRQWK